MKIGQLVVNKLPNVIHLLYYTYTKSQSSFRTSSSSNKASIFCLKNGSNQTSSSSTITTCSSSCTTYKITRSSHDKTNQVRVCTKLINYNGDTLLPFGYKEVAFSKLWGTYFKIMFKEESYRCFLTSLFRKTLITFLALKIILK